MKYLTYIFALLLLFISCNDDDDNGIEEGLTPENFMERVICTNGFANQFPCNNYDMMARISIENLGVTGLNDIWGWTDPSTQKEYALVGTRSNTTFIDITDAEAPIILGVLPTETVNSIWRDIKVYQNHAFVVSEAANHGMQVFDLTRLRNIENPPIVFETDALYTEFQTSHNIVINEESGYAYAVGSDMFLGGPHIINIQDPLNPTFAGGFDFTDYTHDAQVVTYNGPDTDYTGHQILIGSTENFVVIVDVTNPSEPTLISRVAQDNVGFTHQGWFDEDQTFFYANDEVDETEFGFNSRTLVFDLTDLDNPQYAGPYFGPSQAIDHNLYIKGNELFLSNYTNGLRVADITNPDPNAISDIGFFDTFPDNDNTVTDGVWSVYPFFNSGNIIISDVSQGFFILRRSGT